MSDLIKSMHFKLHILCFCAFLLIGTIVTYADPPKNDEVGLLQQERTKLIYRKATSYGVQLHGNGFGISADYINTTNYYKRKFLRFDIMNIKHPKQYKNRTGFGANFLSDQKPYVFGKINSFYTINAARGQMNLIADKGRKNGVELSWLYSYGVSLGIVKPYYLAYCNEFSNCNNPLPIKYEDKTADLFLDPPDRLISRGPARLGWTEIKLYPGLQGKIGFNIDFAVFDDLVQAVEFGIMVNAYYKRVPIMLPIMPSNNNHFIYPNLYIKASMGKRVY